MALANRRTLNKVPLVTLYFWIIKILATTVGETGADFLNFNLGFGLTLTSLLAAVFLVIALAIQFRQDRYVPWVYWLAVVFLSVVGTLITDNLTDNFGVSLYVSTAVFFVALIATFTAWYRSEHTLSIHAITNATPGSLLLGRDPFHFRARHSWWGPSLGAIGSRLRTFRCHLWRWHRPRDGRLLCVRPKFRVGVLVRVCAHSASWCFDWRFPHSSA